MAAILPGSGCPQVLHRILCLTRPLVDPLPAGVSMEEGIVIGLVLQARPGSRIRLHELSMVSLLTR